MNDDNHTLATDLTNIQNKKHVLLIGGHGYIGSHIALLAKKFPAISLYIIDKNPIAPCMLPGQFTLLHTQDRSSLRQLFQSIPFDCVIHLAADISVGESEHNPLKYYENNVTNSLHVLEAMVASKVQHIIFSSTAAVYGMPKETPIRSSHPLNPTSVYGKSKLMVETMIQDFARAYDIQYTILRYFNAAGAMPDGSNGECHTPETHLIPLALQVASKRKDYIQIMGDDYPTADGTCIRDYIHVNDLAMAHWLAYEKLLQTRHSAIYNLGNGDGFSVKQVIDCVRDVTGHAIPSKIVARRPGDPAVLVADPTLALRDLHWQPEYASLKTIIQHAWQWEQHLAVL